MNNNKIINNVNKRIFNNINNIKNKIFELLDNLEKQIILYLSEIKIIYNKLEEDSDIENSLVLLNLLQTNFLNAVKFQFENIKLNDGFYVCKIHITDNKSKYETDITSYFNNDILEDIHLFNNLHIHLNYNNYYIYTLPIFIFNIDPKSNCLVIRICKNKLDDFYYTLTPHFNSEVEIISTNDNENQNKRLVYTMKYYNSIISKNLDSYIDKIQDIKNELIMVENITDIINI